MTGAARDLQAEQDHAEWHGWLEAQGYRVDATFMEGDMADAFAAGMQAERDLAATPAQPAPVSPHLECAVCASGVTSPHGAGGTPGQAVDPSTTAYRVHAYAFNTLTERLARDDQFMPLSVRDAIASAIVEAVEPLIRADDAEQVRLAREDRDQLRKHVLDLAAALDISAAATRPSKKSTIEDELAIALRKIAEPPS